MLEHVCRQIFPGLPGAGERARGPRRHVLRGPASGSPPGQVVRGPRGRLFLEGPRRCLEGLGACGRSALCAIRVRQPPPGTSLKGPLRLPTGPGNWSETVEAAKGLLEPSGEIIHCAELPSESAGEFVKGPIKRTAEDSASGFLGRTSCPRGAADGASGMDVGESGKGNVGGGCFARRYPPRAP
jgi:hypothetical protein